MRALRNFALHAARALGGFRMAQFLTRNRLRIICYHGFSVGDEYQVQPDMFLRAATFERRMRILKKRRLPVIRLDEAVRLLEVGEIRRGETVITIDDGWASTLTIGAPILKRYGFPATVYVTTEHLAAGTEVFNVALYYMILRSPRETLRLAGLHPAIDGSYDLRKDPYATLRSLAAAAESAYPALANRQRALPAIAAALGIDLSEVLRGERFRLLTREQMQALAAWGFDLELHTHRHCLPAQSFEAMKAEIETNRTHLDSILQKRAHHFCFPGGEYSARHPEWLRRLGIVSATTCEPGLNRRGDPVLLLKRYLDNDRQASVTFEAEVSGFLELARNARAVFRGRRRRAPISATPP
ncbi:MAG: polysaccharide deacetylase family protein [Steroidobacteraceae bacterium]